MPPHFYIMEINHCEVEVLTFELNSMVLHHVQTVVLCIHTLQGLKCARDLTLYFHYGREQLKILTQQYANSSGLHCA